MTQKLLPEAPPPAKGAAPTMATRSPSRSLVTLAAPSRPCLISRSLTPCKGSSSVLRFFLFPALAASGLALPQPSLAQDDTTLGVAEFGAELAAEIETVRNLCAQFFFVNPRVADDIQAEGFAMLSQVPEATAKQLLDEKIKASLQEVSTSDPETWCRSTRDRMGQTGGPFAALYAE